MLDTVYAHSLRLIDEMKRRQECIWTSENLTQENPRDTKIQVGEWRKGERIISGWVLGKSHDDRAARDSAEAETCR